MDTENETSLRNLFSTDAIVPMVKQKADHAALSVSLGEQAVPVVLPFQGFGSNPRVHKRDGNREIGGHHSTTGTERILTKLSSSSTPLQWHSDSYRAVRRARQRALESFCSTAVTPPLLF